MFEVLLISKWKLTILFPIITVVLMLVSVASHAQAIYVERSTELGIDTYCGMFSYGQLMYGGVAWFDYDNDGWEDLYVIGGDRTDRLYKNNAGISFTDVTISSEIDMTWMYTTVGLTTGDIDNDGDRDIFITTDTSESNLCYLNNGNGSFSDVSVAFGLITEHRASFSAAFGDYNQDGFLDLYVGNWRNRYVNGGDTSYPDAFYQNQGGNSFENIIDNYTVGAVHGAALAVAFTDYDTDGDADLMIVNDFGDKEGFTPNKLFQNQYPVDDFVDVSEELSFNLGMHSMGIAIGDVDEDGDFDYYITNIASNPFMVQGAEGFTESADEYGIGNFLATPDSSMGESVGWGTAFLDVDNDSYLDLFVANGELNADKDNFDRLYRYDVQEEAFEDISVSAGVFDPQTAKGMAYSDFDKDGDLDIAVGIVNLVTESSQMLLYVNETDNNNNWIEFQLEGVESNRDAFGARVDLFFNGRQLVREVHGGGNSYLSQHSSIVHFGLGDAAFVDSVIVFWPNGHIQSLAQPSVNTLHHIVESTVPTGLAEQLAWDDDLIRNIHYQQDLIVIDLFPGNFISQALMIGMDGRHFFVPDLDKGHVVKINNRLLSPGLYFLYVEGAETYDIEKILILK